MRPALAAPAPAGDMPRALQLVARAAALSRGWALILALLAYCSFRRWWLALRAGGALDFGADGGGRGGRAGGGGDRGGPQRRSLRDPGGDRGGGGGGGRGGRARSPGRYAGGGACGLGGGGGEGIVASEAEIGPLWHFRGRRRWAWLHDGHRTNGWIEFGAGGVLRTSFGGDRQGSWELRDGGLLRATFGKCHHDLELLPGVDGRPPQFRLRERLMKDGSRVGDRRVPRTRGELQEADTPAGVAQRRSGATSREGPGGSDPWLDAAVGGGGEGQG